MARGTRQDQDVERVIERLALAAFLLPTGAQFAFKIALVLGLAAIVCRILWRLRWTGGSYTARR